MKTIKNILFRQQNHVEVLYQNYIEQWSACTTHFNKAIETLLQEGNGEQYAHWCETTHKSESKADDLRRKIEFELYSKALLPESRRDILEIVEATDKILNKVESVLFQIMLENIQIPEPLIPFFKRMHSVTQTCLHNVHSAVSTYFSSENSVMELAEKIDQNESECDHVEREALRVLFHQDFPWHTRFQIKDVIIEMSNITDRAESLSDRLVLHSVKRRV